MSLAEPTPRAGFALRLEQGRGRLVLGPRAVSDLFTVDRLELGLRAIPARLDLSAGVDRFRHHRGEVELLELHADDHDLGRWLRGRAGERVFQDLEVHATDGDLVIVGAVRGPRPAPFLVRARLAPASVAGDRAVLVSVYEARVFTPCALPAPAVARAVLVAVGLEDALVGPTVAVLDPIDRLLFEVCAELGWKVPGRAALRLSDVGAAGGRVRLSAGRKVKQRLGPQGLAGAIHDGGARARRFLADYEAKSLFQAIEALIAEGQPDRAIRAYERQLDLHPEHPFVTARLMQLYSADPHAGADAMALARARLAQADDDPDGLATLAVVQARRGVTGEAAESLARLARSAERQGESAEAAQALWAQAVVLSPDEPRKAIGALEGALTLRRRLPGALRALSDLYGRVGDWAAALHTRERLLAGEADPAARRRLLLDLGAMALNDAGAAEAAAGYFEQVLADHPDDVSALDGLAHAHRVAGRLLPAVRSLDRATQLLQQRGDAAGAAERMVQLGRLWRDVPDEGPATAALRFRQALTLMPGHIDALLGLADAALAGGDAARARGHLEEALRATEGRGDGAQAIAIQLRLGAVYAGPLAAPDRAVVAYQKALRGTPEQVQEAVEALDALYTRQGRAEDLARALTMAAASIQDPAARGGVLARQAEVVAELGDASRARTLLAEASALRPGDADILQAQVNALRSAGDAAELADALAALAQLEQSPADVASLHAERGILLLRQLNRADEASRAFALALGAQPGHPSALRGLADIEREREAHPALARLLAELAEVAPAAERPQVLLELGRLEADELNQPTRALGRFQAAARAWPDDPEPRRRMASLCLELGRFADAVGHFESVEQLYVEEGWAEAQGPFHFLVAQAHRGAGQPELAQARLERAVEADPDLAEAHALARDLLLERGDLDGIVAWSSRHAERARRPEVKVRLLTTAGRLAWRELKQAGRAADLLDRALQLRPDQPELGRLRLEVATALGDWSTVDERLREQLAQAAPRNQPALLTRLAKLSFGALGRPDEGYALLEQAVARRADYAPALSLMAEQAEAAEDWPRARSALERLVASAAAGAADHLALARVELRSGSPEAARRRLDGLPTPTRDSAPWLGLSAQVDDALSDPGRVKAPRPSDAPLAPPLQDVPAASGDQARPAPPEPATVREPSSEPPAGLLAAPAPQAEPASMPAAGEAASVDPGAPRTDLSSGPPAAAPDSIDTLLASMDPSDSSAEQDAEALRTAAVQASPEAAAAAWLAVAEHRRDVLRDPHGAEADFQRALDLGSPGQPAWDEAMEALEDLYALEQRWDGLLGLYDRRIVEGATPAPEVELLKASVLRAAGRAAEALAAAEAAQPAGARAVELLVTLLVEAGRADDAAQALLADVDDLSADDAAHRRWRAAELCLGAQPERALQLFQAAAQRLSDPELFDAWAEAAERVGGPEAQVQVAEARARSLPLEGPLRLRRSGAFLRAARLAAEHQLALPWQGQLLGDALAAWPENPDALEALAEVQRQTGDVAGLRDTLHAQIEGALPGPTRGELALALAKLHLDDGDGPEAARPYLQQAVAELGAGATAEIARQLLTDGSDRLPPSNEPADGPTRVPPSLDEPAGDEALAEAPARSLRADASLDALSLVIDGLAAEGAGAFSAAGAAQTLAEAADHHPNAPRLAALQAWAARLEGQAEAEAMVHAVIVDDPDEPVARWLAAQWALEASDRAGATEHLRVALTAPADELPLPPRASELAFEALVELAQDGAEAERVVEGLLDEQPALAPALGWLRARWSGSSQWPRLLERLEAAVAQLPAGAEPQWWRIELLAGPADEGPAAQEALQAFLMARPEHAGARRLAYGLSAAAGAWADALVHLEATAEYQPTDVPRLLDDWLRHANMDAELMGELATRWGQHPRLREAVREWAAAVGEDHPGYAAAGGLLSAWDEV